MKVSFREQALIGLYITWEKVTTTKPLLRTSQQWSRLKGTVRTGSLGYVISWVKDFILPFWFFSCSWMLLPLGYLKRKYSNIKFGSLIVHWLFKRVFYFVVVVFIVNIFWAMLFFFYRVLGFDFEGYRGSTSLFIHLVFSGFLKYLSFVEGKKNKRMSSQLIASDLLVILSLKWINFYSALLCSMLSVWLEGQFWFMGMKSKGMFCHWTQEIGSNVSYISDFTPSWFSWLAGAHLEVPSSGRVRRR